MTYAFAALAEPMRQAIVDQLLAGPMSVGDLATRLPVTRPAVSQHLKILKEARLVRDEARGTRRIYSIDHSGLTEIRQWLDRFWDRSLEAFAEAAEQDEKENRQ